MLLNEIKTGGGGSGGNAGSSGIDHDAVVTCLACFTYPPYISDETFNGVLDVRD